MTLLNPQPPVARMPGLLRADGMVAIRDGQRPAKGGGPPSPFGSSRVYLPERGWSHARCGRSDRALSIGLARCFVPRRWNMTLPLGRGLVMADSGDSVTGLPELGGRSPVVLDGMRVLRLCSVSEPAVLSERSPRYDAIGGMQNHAAELSRQLDRMGMAQLILTSRLDGPPGHAGLGQWARSCGPGGHPACPAGVGAAGRPAGAGPWPG